MPTEEGEEHVALQPGPSCYGPCHLYGVLRQPDVRVDGSEAAPEALAAGQLEEAAQSAWIREAVALRPDGQAVQE